MKTKTKSKFAGLTGDTLKIAKAMDALMRNIPDYDPADSAEVVAQKERQVFAAHQRFTDNLAASMGPRGRAFGELAHAITSANIQEP